MSRFKVIFFSKFDRKYGRANFDSRYRGGLTVRVEGYGESPALSKERERERDGERKEEREREPETWTREKFQKFPFKMLKFEHLITVIETDPYLND